MKCNDCGHELESPAEYHPHAFCALVKAGYNPLAVVLDAACQLIAAVHGISCRHMNTAAIVINKYGYAYCSICTPRWHGPWIAPDGQVYHTIEEAEAAGAYAEDLAPFVKEDNKANESRKPSRIL